MSKVKTLGKLQALRDDSRLSSGFSSKRDCLSWGAKVEPLLAFNLVYKSGFAANLSVLTHNVSTYTVEPTFDAMLTILDQAIEQLKNELDHDASNELLKVESPTADYVNLSRIEEIRNIKSTEYDLSKLIQLCVEINSCRREKNYYSLIMLVRAIIDHVPPIFGFNSFNEIENNYASPKSFKESISRLNQSSRKIADQHLHVKIRNKEMTLNITQVDFSNDLDILLSEVVRLLS